MKNFGIDGLFNRPTGVNIDDAVKPSTPSNSKEGVRKVGRPKKAEGERETDRIERVTFLGNIETMKKVRAIAAREQLTIKDVIDTALLEIIRRYETKHGKVTVDGESRQNKTLMDVL